MPAKKTPKSIVMSKLEEVLDPELNISVVDLGLIYKVDIISRGRRSATPTIKIIMTLTAIGCPLFSLIEQEIISKIKELGYDEKNIKIELTFNPPWSMDRMTEKGKALLGL